MDFPENITIQSHTISISPRYVDTDKGGVVHHSVIITEASTVLACITQQGKATRIPKFMYPQQ